jgi:quinol monooxygenase YgiN
MSETIVFISHFRIKEGRVDDVRPQFERGARAIEAEKPQTLVFLSYVDPDARAVTIIHAFGDAEAMDLHFEGAEERARAA